MKAQIGKKIANLRRFSGMSQDDLAYAVTVSRGQISLYERGENHITAERLHMVAEQLGRPIQEMFE